MSIRATVTAGSWQNIGTGPATVQLISPDSNGAEVMVVNATTEPSGATDGMVLSSAYPVHVFTVAQILWAQVAQAELTAMVAVQPS